MPPICMICGNYHAGYSCTYCVKEKDVNEEERNEELYYRAFDKEALDKAYKENDDDRRNDSASKDKRNGTGKTWKEEGNSGALEETR